MRHSWADSRWRAHVQHGCCGALVNGQITHVTFKKWVMAAWRSASVPTAIVL
jgi:hypothetical protein